LQCRRRENLIHISEIRGHYPQIFFVNNQRRAAYVGNHEALERLEKQGKLNPSVLSQHMGAGDNWKSFLAGDTPGLDSSFFSV